MYQTHLRLTNRQRANLRINGASEIGKSVTGAKYTDREAARGRDEDELQSGSVEAARGREEDSAAILRLEDGV